MSLELAIYSLPLTPGGAILVFKILSVEVLLGMSALRKYRGIRTPRVIRVLAAIRESHRYRLGAWR